MIGIKIDKVKGLFFDAPKVMRSVDRATRQVLSKFGSFVRRTAKSSIRKRKKASAPGSPPSSHTGLLKRFIYFAYEPEKQSVIIGPAKLNAKEAGTPERLERSGGPTTIVNRVFRRRDGRNRIVKKTRTIQIAPRPFMGPAMNKELPKLSAMWRDSVKP